MPKIDEHFEFKNYAVYAHTYSGSLNSTIFGSNHAVCSFCQNEGIILNSL